VLETLASLRILFIIKLLIQKGRVATQGEGEGSLRTPFSCAATTLSPKERVAVRTKERGGLLARERVVLKRGLSLFIYLKKKSLALQQSRVLR
jgi:uncharacterized lipoprotein YbaY